MINFLKVIISISLLFLTGFAIAYSNNLITEQAVGKLTLGMTIKEARALLKPMILTKTADGEGIPLFAVKEGNKLIFTLFTGENHSKSGKIKQIEIWDARYKTVRGVGVGVSLNEIEKKYGKLKEIVLTEIEAREYATFVNQPKHIAIRVTGIDGKRAGQYSENQNTTTTFSPGAYVYSLTLK